MLKVIVNTVDGGQMDWMVDDSILVRLAVLRRDGLEGRELVNALLTEDWGPPPQWVAIVGTTEDGRRINEYLQYPLKQRRR